MFITGEKKCRINPIQFFKIFIQIPIRHGIFGGSQYLMLDADRLLKGGYIALH